MPSFRDCEICGGIAEEWVILASRVHHKDPRDCIEQNAQSEIVATWWRADRDAALAVLIAKWRTEQARYPNSEGGNHSAASVRLCADELEAALNDPAAAMCDVVREACVRGITDSDLCIKHYGYAPAATPGWKRGKFEAAGGNQ